MKSFYIVLYLAILPFCFGCTQQQDAIATHEHALQGIYDADISSDGQLAIISSITHHLALWDLQTQGVRYLWRHTQTIDEPNQVLITRFATDNRYVVTAEKQAFIIWDVQTGQSVGYWSTEQPIRAIALSDAARSVLIGFQNGEVHHIDLNTGRRLEFYGHTEMVNDVALSPDGKWALSAGNDHQALYWSTDTGAIRYTWPHQARITQVALSESGQLAFSAEGHGQGYIWSLLTGDQLTKLQTTARYTTISRARFNERDTRLLTGGPARDIKLWDASSGQLLQSWRAAHRSSVKPSGAILYAVAFAQDGRSIYTESSNGLGQQWPIR